MVVSNTVMKMVKLVTIEIFINILICSPNGQFMTVVTWWNNSLGVGNPSTLEGKVKLRLYKNFKEGVSAGIRGLGSWLINGMHGGLLSDMPGKDIGMCTPSFSAFLRSVTISKSIAIVSLLKAL